MSLNPGYQEQIRQAIGRLRLELEAMAQPWHSWATMIVLPGMRYSAVGHAAVADALRMHRGWIIVIALCARSSMTTGYGTTGRSRRW
jgi:hypothetical protein